MKIPKLSQIVGAGMLALGSFLPFGSLEAQTSNNVSTDTTTTKQVQPNTDGWLARTDIKETEEGIVYSPQVKWQDLTGRATTQFYIGADFLDEKLQNIGFSFNPLMNGENWKGGIALYGNLDTHSIDSLLEERNLAAEAGFDIGDNVFYVGRAFLPESEFSALKAGRRFGNQRVAFGVTHTNNEAREDGTDLRGYFRGKLGEYELNAKADFNANNLDFERARIIVQSNAIGDGWRPGARYHGNFSNDVNTHNLLMSSGKGRSFSYGGIEGMTDFFFTPRAIVNPGHLYYGNGTLTHTYGENVLDLNLVDVLGSDNDSFSATGYRNFYDVGEIDNLYVTGSFNISKQGNSYSLGIGAQEGTTHGNFNVTFGQDGKPRFSVRFDKALGIPTNKMLLEL